MPSGSPVPISLAALASASYSLLRLIAIWITIAAIGPSTAGGSSAIGFRSRSLLEPPMPPNMAPYIAIRAAKVMKRRDRCRHRTGEDVSILHMPKFVGQHTPDLVPAQRLQQPLCHRHHGVIWVTTRGERVGLRVGGDVQPRHGNLGLLRRLPHHGVVLRHLRL